MLREESKYRPLKAAGLYMLKGLIVCLLTVGCDSTLPTQRYILKQKSKQPEVAPDAGPDIFIIPGWGYELGRLLSFDYQRYASWFQEQGLPEANVHVLTYSYLADLDTIDQELKSQMAAVLQHRQETSRFDVIGHSLGAFVGLLAISGTPYLTRTRKFISLAGIPYGWDSALCATGICGKAHRQLTPFRSNFVNAFHTRHTQFIANLDKCSLYSETDFFVKPYDAGRFDDGRNLDVPGMGHLAAIGERSYFDIMLAFCYDGKLL